jgi:hypothetical protein
MVASGQIHVAAALTPWDSTGLTLQRKLSRHQSRSQRFGKYVVKSSVFAAHQIKYPWIASTYPFRLNFMTKYVNIYSDYIKFSRSQRPRDLRRRSALHVSLNCGFEPSRGHGCLSLVNVVCCQIEVSASG